MRPVLERLRAVHERWMLETRDLGLVPEAEIDRWREQFGPPYAMLRRPGAEELLARLREVVEAGERGAEALPALTAAMDDPDASVRYWAATGLGNLGRGRKARRKTPHRRPGRRFADRAGRVCPGALASRTTRKRRCRC